MKWNTDGLRVTTALAVALLCSLNCACSFMQDMYQQPKHRPLRPSAFFEDGKSARMPVPGTVARGMLPPEAAFLTGISGSEYVEFLPVPLTRELLMRGRERFDLICSTCHDRTGYGNGMIVQRGFRHPPSYHITRLREAPIGHFYDVISHGLGFMPDYAYQVAVRDRWAIVAYIRTLQFSGYAALEDVPVYERQKLGK